LVPLPLRLDDTLALAIPLGLGALSLSALALAVLGVLNRLGLSVVLGIGLLLGWRDAVRCLRSIRIGGNSAIPARRGSVSLVFALALPLTLAGTLVTPLPPVTDGDALCYHLQVPKEFLRRGSAVYLPDLHETVYPLVTEMLYAVGLAFRGPEACRLIQ